MNFFNHHLASSGAWLRRALTVAIVCAGSIAGAVEVNSASQADLEKVSGIGTSLSKRLIDERAKKPFADWADLDQRVSGIGPSSAKRLSQGGLTVNGKPYAGAVEAPVRKPAN